MVQILKEIQIDMAKSNIFNYIIAKQDDTASRYLKVRLTNESEPIFIELNSVVTLNAQKPDDTHAISYGTINEDGTVTIELTRQTLAADGIVKCEISVIDSEGRKLTSTIFNIKVERSVFGEDRITSTDEFSTLVDALIRVSHSEQAIAEASAAAERAEIAADNAPMVIMVESSEEAAMESQENPKNFYVVSV